MPLLFALSFFFICLMKWIVNSPHRHVQCNQTVRKIGADRCIKVFFDVVEPKSSTFLKIQIWFESKSRDLCPYLCPSALLLSQKAVCLKPWDYFLPEQLFLQGMIFEPKRKRYAVCLILWRVFAHYIIAESEIVVIHGKATHIQGLALKTPVSIFSCAEAHSVLSLRLTESVYEVEWICLQAPPTWWRSGGSSFTLIRQFSNQRHWMLLWACGSKHCLVLEWDQMRKTALDWTLSQWKHWCTLWCSNLIKVALKWIYLHARYSSWTYIQSIM